MLLMPIEISFLKASPDIILNAFNQYRLLCARRRPFRWWSKWQNWNVVHRQRLITVYKIVIKVIILGAHYDQRNITLGRNSDIGMLNDEGEMTFFPTTWWKIRKRSTNRLQHETAYVTVHKSQGSEFSIQRWAAINFLLIVNCVYRINTGLMKLSLLRVDGENGNTNTYSTSVSDKLRY